MDDITETTTDYDTWAGDPRNTTLHVTAILERLFPTPSPEELAEAERRRRWPYLVNIETGHLNGSSLCWICAGTVIHGGRHLPTFRACRHCLVVDRYHAERFGLRHLLPVFDWPGPPVSDPPRARKLGPEARAAIGRAWSEVSVLDRWRRHRVRLAHDWMEVPEGEDVDLAEWESRLKAGRSRSVSLWAAYIDEHQPALRRVMNETGEQE